MKKCKSCIQEIDEQASKCPNCQAYQNWYKNPQNYGLILVMPFLFYMWFGTGLFSNIKYEDYVGQFSTTEVSMNKINGNSVHTYKIANNTDKKWNHISYEFTAFDEQDKVLIVITGSKYDLVVQPNSSSLMSVTIKERINAAKWQFKITNMRHERY
jgi:hypothetical protein